jgi:beta-glucosidase
LDGTKPWHVQQAAADLFKYKISVLLDVLPCTKLACHGSKAPLLLVLQSAGALGIMCAYNAVNGTASCASAPLLKKLLRNNMGFDGYVVSDW